MIPDLVLLHEIGNKLVEMGSGTVTLDRQQTETFVEADFGDQKFRVVIHFDGYDERITVLQYPLLGGKQGGLNDSKVSRDLQVIYDTIYRWVSWKPKQQ